MNVGQYNKEYITKDVIVIEGKVDGKERILSVDSEYCIGGGPWGTLCGVSVTGK